MDRYFYSIESDGNERFIHLSANVYNTDGESPKNYRCAEWVFLYIPVEEAKRMFEEDEFYEYVDELVRYIDDLDENEALSVCKIYHNGSCGKYLDILDITNDTPCGNYWFE